MNDKDKCTQCKGEKVKDVEKVIEVPLEKGVPDEHDYVFYGESDELVVLNFKNNRSSLESWQEIFMSESRPKSISYSKGREQIFI
jgi:hypothetical protein